MSVFVMIRNRQYSNISKALIPIDSFALHIIIATGNHAKVDEDDIR